MATVFWDSEGIILIDYKPAGISFTGEYYANVIKQLRVAIKEKWRGKLAAGVLLLRDNALCTRPGPKWLLSVLKFEVPLAWNEISGRWWDQGCYRGLVWGPNRLLFQRHRLLKEKWAKCIEVKGDYIEKWHWNHLPICELNPEFYKLIELPS